MNKNLGLALLVIFAILMLVFFPFAVIWAANQLLPMLAIPYTFWSWLAVCVINIWTFRPVLGK